MTPPPAVGLDLDAPALDYWRDRLAQHTQDSYVGVPLSKFPEDLRAYEHLLWESRTNVAIELGTQFGGSALWLRDRLRALHALGLVGPPLVVSVDLDVEPARERLAAVEGALDDVVLLAGDVRDPALPGLVAEHVPPEARCAVFEDTAHVYETTFAALVGFAGFVPVGGFFVVEDTCLDLDALRLDDAWPQGTLAAVRDWFGTTDGAYFAIRRDLEAYGMTCHPYGFLQRFALPRP